MHIVLIEVTISYVSFMVDTSTLSDIQSSFCLVECWLTVFIRIVRPLLITEMFADFPFPDHNKEQPADVTCQQRSWLFHGTWSYLWYLYAFVFAFARLLFCIFRSDFWLRPHCMQSMYNINRQYQLFLSFAILVLYIFSLLA